MTKSIQENALVLAYIKQLTPQQKKVLTIAQDHLGSSFNIVRSIGFKEWQAARNSVEDKSAK